MVAILPDNEWRKLEMKSLEKKRRYKFDSTEGVTTAVEVKEIEEAVRRLKRIATWGLSKKGYHDEIDEIFGEGLVDG